MLPLADARALPETSQLCLHRKPPVGVKEITLQKEEAKESRYLKDLDLYKKVSQMLLECRYVRVEREKSLNKDLNLNAERGEKTKLLLHRIR